MRTPLLLLIVGLSAAACSDDGDPAVSQPDAAQPDAGPATPDAPTPDAAAPDPFATLPITPRNVTRTAVPDPKEMAGGIGNALAWDPRDGAFWMVTDQQPAGTDPWLLYLYRARIENGKAELLETIAIRENGKHLKGGELDPEGLAVAPDGTIWMVDEGLPALLQVSRQGEIMRRIDPTPLLKDREANRGLEGIALGTDGKALFSVLQNGVTMEKDKLNTFLVEVDPTTGTFVHHKYRLEDPAVNNYPDGLMVPPRMGAHDLHAIGPRSLLVLERDNQSGASARVKRIFKVDVPATLGEAPLTKTLVVDLVKLDYLWEQPEGITMRAPRVLAVVNDNDALPGVPTEFLEITF